MSRPVTLVAGDGTALGNVLLSSDYPGQPPILSWDGMVFRGEGIIFGPGAPGRYEPYVQQKVVDVPAGAVSTPDLVPTTVVPDVS